MIREYLEQLLVKTQKQQEYLFDDNYEQFLLLMEDKQQILKRLEQEMMRAGRKLGEEEKRLVCTILEIDQVNRIEYDRQMEEAKNKLKEINRLKKGQQQYNNPYGEEVLAGYYYDKSGI